MNFAIVRHAVQMVGRCLRGYGLLSITIVLSFSFLFGFLTYVDSNLYNEYKELFATNRGMVLILDESMSNNRLNLFIKKMKELGDSTECVVYTTLGGTLKTVYTIDEISVVDASRLELYNWQIIALPNNSWVGDVLGEVYDLQSIIWLDGVNRREISLGAGEALLPENLYYALGLDQQDEPVYTFRFETGVGSLTLNIVGILEDETVLKYDEQTETLNSDYVNHIIVSQSIINPSVLPDVEVWSRYVFVYSEKPELVDQLAKKLGYSTMSIYEQQNDALEHIRSEKGGKAIIACALLLLLGINLYSSFTNALNDRKFEIGVKRAVGASAGSIVRQFLYESIIVMVANIVISIALVADVFIVYKYIYERIPDIYGNYNTWTIYISPHSIAMFGLCAVTLTVAFSLIFAYKSTRVEIVQYLKAE